MPHAEEAAPPRNQSASIGTRHTQAESNWSQTGAFGNELPW